MRYHLLYGFPVWQTVAMARMGPTRNFRIVPHGSSWGSVRVAF